MQSNLNITLFKLFIFLYSSPDSDDTYPGEEPEEDFSMRDDQFLVSDRTENKFYGKIYPPSAYCVPISQILEV